ncbi:MAG: SDR family oxidoreductase [Corallococcus sp.]|nr:SDR family oxidoreductase [Bacillota bacterium]MCM1533090.1 SDR family oxidoreductase [Corallococcus sp.]
MKVVVTGSTEGIGRAVAQKFLDCGHEVIGIDKQPSSINSKLYTHIVCDVFYGELPAIDGVEILVNNAGVQNSEDDIDVNLKGTIKVTEKYAFTQSIKSVVFIASASARSGAEFPEYVASKGGTVAYMKNVALRLAAYKATANSLSPGGVITELNRHILDAPELWKQVMDETPLKKWATAEEIAEFAYFVSVINKSMTGEDLLIDNGEFVNSRFIW